MLDKKILFFVKTSYWSDYQSNSHGNAAYATLVCPILLFLTLCYWRQSRCDYETDGSYSASRTCPYISTDIVKLYTYNSYTAVIRILIKLILLSSSRAPSSRGKKGFLWSGSLFIPGKTPPNISGYPNS